MFGFPTSFKTLSRILLLQNFITISNTNTTEWAIPTQGQWQDLMAIKRLKTLELSITGSNKAICISPTWYPTKQQIYLRALASDQE